MAIQQSMKIAYTSLKREAEHSCADIDIFLAAWLSLLVPDMYEHLFF